MIEDRRRGTQDGRRRAEGAGARGAGQSVFRRPRFARRDMIADFGFRVSCRRVLAVALVLSAGGLFGCAQSQAQRQYYLLAAERPPTAQGEAPAGPERGVLLVRSFRMAPAFAGRQLVYRVGDFRYETDYYHQYLVPPEEMLAERTRDWLASSGLFRQVIGPGSVVPPTWTLTGDVSALYGDFAGPGAPTAVLEIRFSLLGPPEGNEPILFAQSYRAASPVTSRTADAVVAALSFDLAQILTQFEADLRQRLAEPARPARP